MTHKETHTQQLLSGRITNSLLKHMAYQPITLQELNIFRHVDKLLNGRLKLASLLVQGILHKWLIYWDFHTQTSPVFILTAIFFPVLLVQACESRPPQAALVVVGHT